MTFDFRGQVVLVTGASRGMGEAIATAFTEAGAALVATARERTPLDALCARLASTGATVEAEALDVADVVAAERVVERPGARHGCIDVLVNNAGTSARQPTGESTAEVWDAIFAPTPAACSA